MNLQSGWQRFWSRYLPATKHDLKEIEKHIMAKLSELAGQVQAQEQTVEKVFVEVGKLKERFDKLTEQLANVDIPAAAQASLDKISERLAALDLLNDDEPGA